MLITLSRNGGPALHVCTSSFGTSPHLDTGETQPKTDGTAEMYGCSERVHA